MGCVVVLIASVLLVALLPSGDSPFVAAAFLSAVGTLAKSVDITTVAINGIRWCEVDFPVDLQQARQLAASWA